MQRAWLSWRALGAWLAVLCVVCRREATATLPGGCPATCDCALDSHGRREVKCDSGGLKDPLPVAEIPSDVEALVIDAPRGVFNELTIGPIFGGFKDLQTSNVPSLGQH